MSNLKFQIASREIGPEERPYVIAEVSNNHLRDKQRLIAMIDEAAKAGVDAVKIQTYDARTITLDSDKEYFQLRKGPWAGHSLFELYDRINMPRDWIPELFGIARDRGVSLFSSVAHPSDVDFLEKLECPAYKIASFELVDLPLIRHAGATGKPVILSTGLANLEEIEAAVETCLGAGAGGVSVLHCISAYPAPASESNLMAIASLQERVGALIGLSDHSLDPTVVIAAVALGARVIEKHFTLRREDGGPDAEFSLEPHEFREMVRNANIAFDALGSREIGLAKPSEEPQRLLRKSLFWARNLDQGTEIGPDDVVIVRPGYGLAPGLVSKVVGGRVQRSVERHEPVRPEDVAAFSGQ